MDFHDLYTRYAADVHRFSMYLACNRALADDITGDTRPTRRACRSAAPIREATVKAYLFAIARNVYLQELRRTSRHDELDDSIPSTSPRQDARVEQRAALGAVLRALRGFSAVDRVALLMRTQDGTSYEEIAHTLGLSVSAAKVKVHRARMKLALLI